MSTGTGGATPDTAATGLEDAGDRLAAARDAIARAVPAPPVAGWSGTAADAAAHTATVLGERHRALLADVDAVLDALARAAGALRAGADTAAVDDALAAALDAAGHGPPFPTVATVATAASPSGGPDPAAVARWWAALDPATRELLERERPALVGGLDGLPAAVRDRANRTVLAGVRAAAQQEERAVWARLAGARDPVTLLITGGQLHEVRARLARLAAVAAAVDRPGRALLDLEVEPRPTSGPGVRAAVAQGDVDSARHVGVLTPGFTTGVDKLPGRLDELSALAADAGPGTATVAWYGYDTPQADEVGDPDRSVLDHTAAEEGGARLATFLDGLDAARPVEEPDAHVTAVGHSYGSVVTAAALAIGDHGVDDVVHLGSPGIGDAPTGPPGHVWVVEAAGDPVADTGWFGPDPNRLPGVTGLSAREVVLPEDLANAMDDAARSAFDRLAPSHKKEWVRWVEEAKKAETRTTRIEKTVSGLKAGKKTH